MRNLDQDGLARFLGRYTHDPVAIGLIPEAAKTVEPFLAMMKAKDYPLAPCEDISAGDACRAITAIRGQQVCRVVPLSAACPFPRPEYMSADAYLTALESSVCLSVGCDLSDIIIDAYGEAIGQTLKREFGSRFIAGLVNGLGDCLGARLGNRFSLPTLAGLTDDVATAVLYYLGLAVLGDIVQTTELARLLGFLTRAIPLGTKQGEPGTWIVLTA